mgnify:CR=1 FL=1
MGHSNEYAEQSEGEGRVAGERKERTRGQERVGQFNWRQPARSASPREVQCSAVQCSAVQCSAAAYPPGLSAKARGCRSRV